MSECVCGGAGRGRCVGEGEGRGGVWERGREGEEGGMCACVCEGV